MVRSLVVLGDSTAVGIGDPLPDRTWRGFGPLLADAVRVAEPVRYLNLSVSGARISNVRRQQLPAALRREPDVAVLVAGMNDTLRSDFEPARLYADLDRIVGSLRAAGAAVLTARYHDHSKVFRLPGPLRRALVQRIGQLNEVTDAVVARHAIGCLDLDRVPGAYERAAWSVDRLHPSELGHRMLARGFARMLADTGWAVPHPVSLACSGGAQITGWHHLAWLAFKGVPWLWRRGRDLMPYAAAIIMRELLGEEPLGPQRALDVAQSPVWLDDPEGAAQPG
ncbi:SGNH/GDSL hydrolase family protein [Gandjariella thermophila]|uniref:SGNH hydrolase n=1 Tax=Gandjariella thermophila TaxID=1931992 RepID=A0A4D4IXA9_9PSEU|nr:SGNH/GDSL hydrolase family protein [Gandjariella thermophila]GDY28831.1 SGNH hydrolase [Gandjariella thermophila]